MKKIFGNINPAILIIVALLLGNNMLTSNMSLGEWLYDQLLFLPGILIGLTFHEAAHGYASYKLGDPTPKLQGRLTLNPLSHVDPIGFLTLFFAGFGWGRPVEINPMYYKNRRRDELIVSLAGVATNLLIAIAACFAMRFTINHIAGHGMNIVSQSIFFIFDYMMRINIVLMVFNLLPIPPLDGFGVLTQIFNLKKYNWYYTLYSNGFLILMVLIVFNITDKILTPAVGVIFTYLVTVILGA